MLEIIVIILASVSTVIGGVIGATLPSSSLWIAIFDTIAGMGVGIVFFGIMLAAGMAVGNIIEKIKERRKKEIEEFQNTYFEIHNLEE